MKSSRRMFLKRILVLTIFRNNELSALLEKAKGDAVAEFQASKQFTDLLGKNYAAGFEDFRLDAAENFPNLDFSAIKLNLGATTSSLLQTSSEDVNIEDDASTHPPPADVKDDAPPAWRWDFLFKHFIFFKKINVIWVL